MALRSGKWIETGFFICVSSMVGLAREEIRQIGSSLKSLTEHTNQFGQAYRYIVEIETHSRKRRNCITHREQSDLTTQNCKPAETSLKRLVIVTGWQLVTLVFQHVPKRPDLQRSVLTKRFQQLCRALSGY